MHVEHPSIESAHKGAGKTRTGCSIPIRSSRSQHAGVRSRVGPFGSDPFEIPGEDAPVNSIFAELIYSLAVIQNNVDADLAVPDLETLTIEAIQSILQFAALVRGETIRDTWESVEMDIHLASELPIAPASQLALESSFSITIGERVVTLEPVTIVMAAAALEAVTQGEITKIIARPALGNNTRLTVRSTVEELDVSVS